jgi:Tfp pilus assembly protein PilP
LLQIIYYGFTCRDPNSKEFRVFATQHLNGGDFIKEKVKPKKSILDKFNMNA